MRVTIHAEIKHSQAGTLGVTITVPEPADGAMRAIFDALSKFASTLSDRTQSTMPFRIETTDLLGDPPAPATAEPTLGDRRLGLYLKTINSWIFSDPLTPQQIKLDKLLNEMSAQSEPELMSVVIDNTIRCIDEALKEPT